ncbi:hypothetical protein TWF730_008672 [Orbilia blumenaviensis]|uniref:Uncharacterized protein n=1 Tax=Orbilia blumenaviensis TaxID=1796055 RepID=A0AAV9V477_9PEZI
MKLLRCSGFISLWVQLQTLIFQVNHAPVASAAIVEIPLNPDLTDYLHLNLGQFVIIGDRIDKLKINKELRCPVKEPSDTATYGTAQGSNWYLSLTYLIRKLNLAEDQLKLATKMMQDSYVSDQKKLKELLSKYKFPNITSAEAARDRLTEYRMLFAGDLAPFYRFSKWLDWMPGLTIPKTGDEMKNLINLSWQIEGATVEDFNEERKLKVDTTDRNFTLGIFQDIEARAKTGAELAAEATLWASQNVQAEFKQFAHNDFTLATVFRRIGKWYECWQPPLPVIIKAIGEKLGPFPIWERED